MTAGLVLFVCILQASAGPSSPAASSDQQILHLLNRISFGPRPGDVDRVRATGITNYIDEQLHPERIDDSTVAPLLAAFPSLGVDPAEINKKYVAPQSDCARTGKLIKPGNLDPAANGNNLQADPKNRAKIQAYYQQHGLNPPQKLPTGPARDKNRTRWFPANANCRK